MIKILFEQINNVLTIVRILKISNFKKLTFVSFYYLLTLLLGILDGIGLLLLVGIILDGPTLKNHNNISEYIINFLAYFIDVDSTQQLLYLVIIIFFFTILIKVSLGFLDALIWTFFRTKLQNTIYYNYINADWLKIYDFKVGDVANTLSWEVRSIAKYIQNCFQVFYSLLLSLVFLTIAISTSVNVFLVCGLITLPIILFFTFIYRKLTFFSKLEAENRNILLSDITERLNGLFQIIAENNLIYHYEKGIKKQKKLWNLEIKQGILQTLTAAFSIILILFALISFYIYSIYINNFAFSNISLFASIGVLGIKLLSSFNQLISNVGNILRLSGSMKPVIDGITLKNKRSTINVKDKIFKIKLKEIIFNYGLANKKLIKNLSIEMNLKFPVIISGSSGSGKTTLANIISGIYLPEKGEVVYIDSNNNEYNSKKYNVNVGYVTQNIHLFRGTIKEFLCEDKIIDVKHIYEVLSSVGLLDFIKANGGIDTKVVEGGRSFSGGQIRRLGIAKMLLAGSQVIILDEPTAGLDDKNKNYLLETIKKLSTNYIIIIISHDKIDLQNSIKINLDNLNSEK